MRMDARGRAWLLAAAGLLAPVGATAQSALQQLEQACRDSTGADCRVNVPAVPQPSPAQGGQGVQQGEAVRSTRPNQATTHRQVTRPQARPAAPRAPPPKTTEQVVREQLAAGLAQAFLSVLLAPPEPTSQAPQGPTPEELAERERRRVEELQRRTALVAEQRASRDAQQTSNMESMASAFGAGFDRPAEPGGGDPVRLAGTTPSLFAPPVYRSPVQAAPLSPAVTRLAALAAENEDVAALKARFADLSGRLDAALAEADAIGRMGRNRVQEYERMEQTVAEGVADAWDRGMSLAVDGLLLGHAKAISRVEEVRSNARAWTTLKSMLHDAQRGAELADGVNERIEQVEQTRADAAFLTRQRAFNEDVAYLAERFGGPFAEHGKSILASAKTVREELEVLRRQRELEGFERRYEERRVRVDKELRALVVEVKRTRRELAAMTGLDEQAIPRPKAPTPPGSFGTQPPPVPVE